MIENLTDAQNSTQAAQIEDLDQQIADKKARLAEHTRLAHSARLRLHAYSDASLYAHEERHRRQELWAKIVEQLHNIGERYGIDLLRNGMPGFTACHLCPSVPPTNRPFATGVLIG